MRVLAILAVLGGLSGWACGAGVGVYGGSMDTADFGRSKTAGAKLEADLLDFIALELRGGYAYDFRRKDLGVDDFEMFFAEAGLRLTLRPIEYFSLHAGFGGGYYVMPEFDAVNERGDVLPSDIEDTGGVYGLVGAELGSVNFRVFAEAKYLVLQPGTVKAEFPGQAYREIDTDLSGVALLAGVMIRW